MPKLLRIDTPLPLADIVLSDKIGLLQLEADKVSLAITIPTGFDGSAQRRLVCNTSGELTVNDPGLETAFDTSSAGDGTAGAILKKLYDIFLDVYDSPSSSLRTTNAV